MSVKRGLTLVETIVLIIIFGILLTVLPQILKSYLPSHNDSRKITCKSLSKQWGVIFLTYCKDNNGNFSSGIAGQSNRDDWLISLKSYYDTKGDIIKCPQAKLRRTDSNDYGSPNNTYQISIKDEDTGNIPIEASYGINCWVYNPPSDSNLFSSLPSENFWRTRNYPNASQVPIFADSMWVGGYPEPDGKAGQPPSENGQWDGIDAEMKHFCIDRHSGAINIAFMDGHVEEVELKRLWKYKWHKNFDTSGKWTQPDALWPEWMK